MIDNSIFQLVVGLAAFLGGFVLNALWNSVSDLRKADKALTDKVAGIEILVAGSYVKRDEMDRMSQALFAKLDRIETKLDNKVGRDECEGCSRAR